jgi:tRNA (cmo5U34)-methyltransferase
MDWTFNDARLTAQFDRYVREQLPWYDIATDAVAFIARQYVPRGGLVYDLGCSTGNISRAIQDTCQLRGAKIIALDDSPEMVRSYIGPGVVELADVAEYEPLPYDLAISFLTFMFIDAGEVANQIIRWRSAARPGGALILVERTVPVTGYAALVLSRLTLNAKKMAGMSGDAIIEKELALSGIQRPLDRRLLDSLGAVEFFRFADFGGYIVEARHDS